MTEHPTPRLDSTHPDRPETREVGDAELVERYRRHRDHDAFTVLVHRHAPGLRATAMRMLRDPQDAADVVQLTWIDVLGALAGPDGSFDGRSTVSTWLGSIVRNEAIDRMRRNKLRTHPPLEHHPDPVAPGDAYTAADARMVVIQLLDVLPDLQREAIELVWLRGLTVAEAATVLDVRTGTVKSRCARARQAMAAAAGRAGLITTALHDEHQDPPRS